MGAHGRLPAILALAASLAAAGSAHAGFPGRNGRIAYVMPGQGLMTANAHGRDRQMLIDDGAAESPSFSPNGHWLAFDSDYVIWRTPADADGREQLPVHGAVVGPEWLAGGHALTFMRYEADPTDICREECVGESVIRRFYRSDLHGRHMRSIGIGNHLGYQARPSFSPSGRLSAYNFSKDDGCIRIAIRAHGRNRAYGIEQTCTGTLVDWSPTSRSVLYVTHGPSEIDSCVCPISTQIWSIRIDGAHARLRARIGGDVQSVQWSPDGRYILFSHEADHPNPIGGVYKVRSSGGKARLIIPGAGQSAWQPLPRRR